MTPRPAESSTIHTRLMKCALEIEASRAYWRHVQPDRPPRTDEAFEGFWFGARSFGMVEVLLANMRVRFDAYPSALAALRRWPEMSPDTRRLVCHWHLQLADPLYRAFTGEYLVTRRAGLRAQVTRDRVVGWVAQAGPERWTLATHIQFASKLLSAAFSAGLVTSSRDPRPLGLPRVPDDALEYLLYLLRETTFAGHLLDNPYTRSVGLEGGPLEDRLRALPTLAFKRQGDLFDFGWRHADLHAWADARLPEPPPERDAP